MAFFLLLPLLLAGRLADGAIYKYNNALVRPFDLLYRRSAMYASPPGTNDSFVRLDLRIVPQKHMAFDAKLEVGVMSADDFSHMGYQLGNSDNPSYCCDEAGVQANFCKEENIGRLAVPPGAYLHEVVLGKGSSPEDEVSKAVFFPVHETGVYYVVISSCDARQGEFNVVGQSEWRNPFGFLPGEQYGNLPFWTSMLVAYLVLGLAWTCRVLQYRSQVVWVHHWISGVLAVALLEAILSELDYSVFNGGGVRSKWLFCFSALFMVARKTVARMLIFVVATGWGISQATLKSSTKSSLCLFAVVYTIAALIKGCVAGPSGGRKRQTMTPRGKTCTGTWRRWAKRRRPTLHARIASTFLFTGLLLLGIAALDMNICIQPPPLTVLLLLYRLALPCSLPRVPAHVCHARSLVDGINQTHEIPAPKHLLEAVVGLLDFGFAIWVWLVLRQAIRHLRSRSQEFKLRLYLAYRRCLVLIYIAAGLFGLLYLSHLVAEEDMPLYAWGTAWLYQKGWDAFFVLVLLIIMWLWMPTEHSG